MIAGLPLASWALLLLSVGLGLGLELAHLRAHRGSPADGDGPPR